MTDQQKVTDPSRLPSSVNPELNAFDRFASRTSKFVSRATFFGGAVTVVILWLIEGAIRIAATGQWSAFLNQTYQLQINSFTTVITFLLVALLQNTSARDNEALQEKINAIALALISVTDDPDAIEELKQSVGLEQIVGADDQ